MSQNTSAASLPNFSQFAKKLKHFLGKNICQKVFLKEKCRLVYLPMAMFFSIRKIVDVSMEGAVDSNPKTEWDCDVLVDLIVEACWPWWWDNRTDKKYRSTKHWPLHCILSMAKIFSNFGLNAKSVLHILEI